MHGLWLLLPLLSKQESVLAFIKRNYKVDLNQW